MKGALIAFEGIDQAGKMTQVRKLSSHLTNATVHHEIFQYPNYVSPIGHLLEQALCEGLALQARARTMLFAANRWEYDPQLRQLHDDGAIVLVDRYSWSNIVYGLSLGYDEGWLRSLEEGLLPASLTFFIDISPAESVRRKNDHRDRFEADTSLLDSARDLYSQFAKELNWEIIDGAQTPERIQEQVVDAVRDRLGTTIPGLSSL